MKMATPSSTIPAVLASRKRTHERLVLASSEDRRTDLGAAPDVTIALTTWRLGHLSSRYQAEEEGVEREDVQGDAAKRGGDDAERRAPRQARERLIFDQLFPGRVRREGAVSGFDAGEPETGRGETVAISMSQ